MTRCPLSALLTAALGTAALSVMSANVIAQAGASKQKSAPAASHPANSAPAPTKATSSDDVVVGTCNTHKVTWGQLVAKMRADNPVVLNQSISAIVAGKVTDAFFGAAPKETFTITKSEAIGELRQHPNQQISQMLELMLTQFAIDDEATKENVQPTQKQVDDKIAQLLKQLRDSNRIRKGQTDEQFLAENHYTMAKLKNLYRPQCQALNLIDKEVTKKLGHPVGPGDLIQASHILIKVIDQSATATAEEKKKADEAIHARIKLLLADIRAGKISFADAAKANSDDPGSKDKGGDLGIFIRGMMLPEFENAAFAAKVNEVTEPVKSNVGYHIILVSKLGKDIPAAERTKFIESYEENQITGFIQQAVEKEKVDNRLAKLVPPPQSPNFGAPGRGRPQ